MVNYLVNNPALAGGMVVSFLIALIFLSTARRAYVRDRFNFINVPAKRSCFDCADHFVLAPGQIPADSARATEVKKNVLACRAYMRDEMRLPQPALSEKWDWICDEEAQDYASIGSKCPQFTLIQGGKK